MNNIIEEWFLQVTILSVYLRETQFFEIPMNGEEKTINIDLYKCIYYYCVNNRRDLKLSQNDQHFPSEDYQTS